MEITDCHPGVVRVTRVEVRDCPAVEQNLDRGYEAVQVELPVERRNRAAEQPP